MRRRRQPQRFTGKNGLAVPHDRRAQRDAIGQRGAAEKLDRGTNRAIDIAGEALPRAAARALRIREGERRMAALQPSKILGIEMAEAEDQLQQHRQQRQELRRAAEIRPPNGETAKHCRQHKRNFATLTTIPCRAKPRG